MQMLLPHQIAMLKEAVGPRDEHGNFSSSDNEKLNDRIKRIKYESPSKFHTEETLKERVFYNQPKPGIACAGYIVSRKPDPLNF